MFGRRRRPLMRAAVVGGVAYHAGKRGQQSREEDYDRDARIAELEAQQAAQPAPAPAAAPQTDMVEQLQKLAALKDQGILTQAEFDAQKAKLLAGVSGAARDCPSARCNCSCSGSTAPASTARSCRSSSGSRKRTSSG